MEKWAKKSDAIAQQVEMRAVSLTTLSSLPGHM